MLRGSIDFISTDNIAGWIYSPAIDLKGQLVLAFDETKCLGAGNIAVFRKDLREAGLGHGYFGYDFAITGNIVKHLQMVFVRLHDSDAIFVQKASRLTADAATQVTNPFVVANGGKAPWKAEHATSKSI